MPVNRDYTIGVRSPNEYFSRPTNRSLIGYIGGVGPFYTDAERLTCRGYSGQTRVKFAPKEETLEYVFPDNTEYTVQENVRESNAQQNVREHNVQEHVHGYTFPDSGQRSGTPRRGKKNDCNFLHTTPWIYLTLVCLTLSCLLVYISFLSNEWGTVGRRQRGDGQGKFGIAVWRFGLWMSCRDDGVCLGLQWPAFYGACRAFYVLTLFTNSLSLAWLLGHQLERLLKYDDCTMLTLSALCLCSGVFSLAVVTSFGVYWRAYMMSTFPDGQLVFISINYAFYVAVATVPLSLLAGLFLLVDTKGSWKKRELEKLMNKK